MRKSRRALTLFACGWIPLLLGALSAGALPTPAAAQTEPQRSWAVVPMLGFGVVRNGDWGSAGVEAAVELEYSTGAWRGSGYASQRGFGVGCSHRCFDGGPAVALGGARSLGRFWIGGGAGVMKDFGEWQMIPYGRVSLDVAPVRIDVRVELARDRGWDFYVPVLMGIPIRIAGPGSG